MLCPFCKKEIDESNGFCPECGQKLEQRIQISESEHFWDELNKDASKRNEQYKKQVNKVKKEEKIHSNKTVLSFVLIIAVIMTVVFGRMKYNAYSSKKIAEVQSQLIGQTFTAHDEHMEGLGWIMNEYWQLTFLDNSNLKYAYLETTGPKEENENPEYKGTFDYSISRSLVGTYTISTNGETYELKINDDNKITGITRK